MIRNSNDVIENGSTEQEQYKMLSVLISGGNQNPVTIVIRKYQYGDSVAKLVNLCPDLTITLKQKSSDSAWQLEPMSEMFFVWPDLIKSTRELYWSLADATPVVTAGAFSSGAQHYEPIKLTKSSNDKYQFMVPAHLVPNTSEINSPRHNANSDTETNGKSFNSESIGSVFFTFLIRLKLIYFLNS